jgi:zinc protease
MPVSCNAAARVLPTLRPRLLRDLGSHMHIVSSSVRVVVRSMLALVLALVPFAAVAALPAGVSQGATVEGVTEYALANGLKVLLFPDASKPTTTVDVTYRVGSRQESYGETGMAHLLEHMLFKGTPSIPSVFTELSSRGMRFNGNTSYDRTTYFETFTANDENLEWAIRMESERMTRSTFSKAELDSEMTVVRNEFESGENNPRQVLWKRMAATAFDWHNYGKPTIGARSDIENVPFEHLRAFYAMYYQPDNAVLTIAGRFDPDRTLALVAKYFGALPKPTRVLPKLYTSEPVQDGERTVVVQRVASSKVVGALFHTVPGPSPDAVAIEALSEIMTVQPAGRLYKALVETGKATSVENWAFDLHDPGFVIFWAQVNPSDPIEPARDGLLATLYAVKQQPITDAEVDRVRTKALKDFDDTINDPQRFAVAVAEAVAQGDWRLFFLDRDHWRALKTPDVNRVAQSFIKPSNLTLGEFLPETTPDRAPAVASVDVEALVKDYKGDAAVAAGEAFDATPANLEARTQRLTLPNGLKVALLPKQTRGSTVRFQMRLDFGDEQSLKGTPPATSLTAAMLNRGTTRHDRQAFEDALDRLKAKLAFGGGGATVTASGETIRASLPEVLDLMAEALISPSFAPNEFTTMQRARITRLEQGRTDPSAIAQRAVARQDNPYPPGDVRYAPTLDEEIAMVNGAKVETLKAFHSRFFGASHAEIAIVGDFDAAAARTQIEKLFANWSSPTPYQRVPDPYLPTKGATLTFETPDKPNATLIGKQAMRFNDVSPDYPVLLVADHILGGGSDSRIFKRVRVTEGLSYGVGTALQPASIDDNSAFIVYAIFAPQNVAKVRTAFTEELARVAREPFTAQEVTEAKRALLEERRIARADDGNVAAALVSQQYLGRTWELSAKIDAAIQAVTPEQATAVARKYLQPQSVDYALAGDFKAAK